MIHKQPVYANYAATTPALTEAVCKELRAYLMETHFNMGRNFEGLESGAIALRARRAVAGLFGVSACLRVIFTSGATAALNMAIHGLVRPGVHVLATSIEHNAVARPLEALRKAGVIDLGWLPCAPDGSLEPETVRKAIRKNTGLLVMTHASNVLGTILPATDCFKIAREYGVFTILDMAQTGGSLPYTIDDCCDIAVFAGHKGLGGLAGTGGFVLGERAVAEMRPWMAGGTGSASHSLDMPDFLPDKFEPGTQNTFGILSLAASIEEIIREGCETIREHERALTARFLAGLRGIKKAKPYGPLDAERSVAVVPVVICGHDAGDVARRLFEKHGIITRSGLHCSPLAHKTAGTFPEGAVRFSFGRGSTEAEIDTILEALDML
ncbi:MAG: aminotransferase class V-fold PLP-dependent enzyme [Spirochaetaceae bacterium]|jgi:cysteine desulfurase family protein|nr:aminotransferase class V-fold PLP-dependent enzyme [Spirochaetaceae bacterium]